MKKINRSLTLGVLSLSIVFSSVVSCSVSDIESFISELSKPTLNFKGISIDSLDTEGISFKCDYSITNPYSIDVSVAQVAADITCDGNAFTSITANEGVSLAAKSEKENSFDFKVPYDSLINFAKSYTSGATSLPFNVSGSVGLDLSKVTSLTDKTLSLPFSKSIDAPVIKPSFSFSDPKVVLPTRSEILDSLVNDGGMNPISAAATAVALLAGQSVDSSVFDKVNLNIKLNFDMSVSNSGSSAWSYLVKNCSINTGEEGENALISLDTSDSQAITSSSGTVPLTATLNTLKFGKFIAKIINKSGTNPSFSIESGISFPEIESLGGFEFPLSFSKEIKLSEFGLAND